MRRLTTTISALLCLAAASASANTLQERIDAAPPGATLTVTAGTYGPMPWLQPPCVLHSESASPNDCIARPAPTMLDSAPRMTSIAIATASTTATSPDSSSSVRSPVGIASKTPVSGAPSAIRTRDTSTLAML